MKLKLFEIQSYRSCIKTKLQLHNELTALIGTNGSGKSNILNGLLLLKKICQSRNRGTYKDSSYNKCKLYCELEHEGKTIYLKSNIGFATDERNFDEVQFYTTKWNFKEFTKQNMWLEIPLEPMHAVFQNRLTSLPSNADILRYSGYAYLNYDLIKSRHYKSILPIFSNVYSFFNNINYYSASQFSDPSRCPVSIEQEEGRLVKKLRINIGHEQFLMDLYRSWKAKNIVYKRFLSTVNQEGIGLVEDISFTEVDIPSNFYQVQSGGKIRKFEKSRLLIVPNFKINDNILSPNQLSEGTLKTLALLFYLLIDDSKILLIEEPEVCIHHGLLNSIITLIKSQSKKKQIVLSTHSDFVLDQLAPENILLVHLNKQKGTTAKTLTKSLSKNDYIALRQYLEESGNLGEYWKDGGLLNE